MQLENKVALVTAASNGIGAAIALDLAAHGCIVYCNYRSDDAAAEKIKEQAKDGVIHLSKGDIADEHYQDSLTSTIKEDYGRIDFFVSNAGVVDSEDNPLDAAVFRRNFEINVFSHVSLTAKVLPLMSSGKILYTSSVHGFFGRGNPGVSAYSASKAALNSYMMNLAKHLAPDILVNAVAPGRTLTPAWGVMSDAEKKQLAQAHLTQEWILPAEVAHAVRSVLENDALCGQILTVDAGMSLVTLG